MHQLCVSYTNCNQLSGTLISCRKFAWNFFQDCILHVLSAHDALSTHPLLQTKVMWKGIYIVSAHPLQWDCSLYWEQQQASDKIFTCRWLENSRFWHSSLDRQLHLSIGKFSLQKVFVVYFCSSFHSRNFF